MTGTPAESKDENVVQKRASATLCESGPNTGGRSLKRPTFSAACRRDPTAHEDHDDNDRGDDCQ